MDYYDRGDGEIGNSGTCWLVGCLVLAGDTQESYFIKSNCHFKWNDLDITVLSHECIFDKIMFKTLC